MNGRKAKLIRKIVYGDYSQRERTYCLWNKCTVVRTDKHGSVYIKLKKLFTSPANHADIANLLLTTMQRKGIK